VQLNKSNKKKINYQLQTKKVENYKEEYPKQKKTYIKSYLKQCSVIDIYQNLNLIADNMHLY
jgi:hypothetical protein